MTEQHDDGYASMDDHAVEIDGALSSLAGGDQDITAAATPEDDNSASALDGAADVETAPEPPPVTMDAMVQALMPAMAQAMGQALAPLIERLPQHSAPEPAPGPKPWELTGDAALMATPPDASDYTRSRIARTRQEISRWEPAASNPDHEKHADAKRMVAHHQEQLRDQYHLAELEAQLQSMRSEFEQMQRAPAIQAIAARAKAVVASADSLAKGGYTALAAAVKAGDDITDIVGDVDWSQPEERAVADLERALRIANRAEERAQARQAPSPGAADKAGRKATPVPPSGPPGHRSTDDGNDFLSMEEHDALHERLLKSRSQMN